MSDGRRSGLLARSKRWLSRRIGMGPAHRSRLADADVRIAVSGTRGKSSVTRWLHDAFHERGRDTYAKVTGTTPVSVVNGVEREIPRDRRVTLYENEREFARHAPAEVAVFENQGITPYTTRLVNENYVDPDVVVLCNVRSDHLGTLGNDRREIARGLARAVPKGTTVVCGERDERLRSYLERELDRREATYEHVSVPDEHAHVPGSECVYAVDATLAAVGEDGLTYETVSRLVDSMRVSWTDLPAGPVYNAADVNDVESTEVVRRSLVAETGVGHHVLPVVYLRHDRRGRTASFRRYLDDLSDRKVVSRVVEVGDGPGVDVFADALDVPVETYAADATDPEALLDATLSPERPTMLMGNTVASFMEAVESAIEDRAAAAAVDRDDDTNV